MTDQIVPATLTTIAPVSVLTTNYNFAIKLTPRNYLAWKSQFLPLLNYHDMNSFIDGSLAPSPTIPSTTNPTENIVNPAYTKWFQRDQLLLSWILSSLSEEVYSYIIDCSTSFAAWKALESAFGSVSQNRQLQLYVELRELKKHDMSITQYLQKAKSLADELAAAGRPISPAEFNAIIYRNIGIDFHPIVSALNLRAEPISFSELYSQLLSHEILLHSHHNLPMANIAFRPPTPPTSRPPLLSSPNLDSKGPGTNRRTCQICGYNNHTTDRCRKRYAPRQSIWPQAHFAWHSPQPPPTFSWQGPPMSFPNSPLSPHHAMPSLPYQGWFPDTGATHHMTPFPSISS